MCVSSFSVNVGVGEGGEGGGGGGGWKKSLKHCECRNLTGGLWVIVAFLVVLCQGNKRGPLL